MKSLEPPELFSLHAVEGWTELGNLAEAMKSLESIPKPLRNHPDVLEAVWKLHSKAPNWPACIDAATKLQQIAPDRVSGWIFQAYALRRVDGGGLDMAWKTLLPASLKFPAEPMVGFNLACYACQMGNLDDARRWLQRASKLGGQAVMLRLALQDEDLKPLWPELRPE